MYVRKQTCNQETHKYSSNRNVLTFHLMLLRLNHLKYTNSYLNVHYTRFECLLGMKSNHPSEKYSLQSKRLTINPSLPIDSNMARITR